MADMYTLGAGEGEATWFLQNRMVLKATAETTRGAYGLIESTIAPGASPPLHVHRREDEAFYVLEGELTFRFDGEDHAGRARSSSCPATSLTPSWWRPTGRRGC